MLHRRGMDNAALGAAAVAGAVLAFGSFGVPIKSRRLQDAQVLRRDAISRLHTSQQGPLRRSLSGKSLPVASKVCLRRCTRWWCSATRAPPAS